MTDPNSQFFAILTTIGKAKQANADALGVPWTFTQMGVGDANDTPSIPQEGQTKLINERRRAPLNLVRVDDNNANIIVAEQIIPEAFGGWWIREIGLYDADDDLVAVANCPPTYKPLLSQGAGRTQIIRMNLIVSNTANIELKIDPSVVLATRAFVETTFLEMLPPNKTSGTYTKVTINARGIVQEGSNPTTLADYGVSFASEVEAQTGADTNKPMNALRVFQAINAKVIQATGSALGIARIAAQPLVNAGDDDTTIVTPKKLRWGVSMLLGANGYIALPAWLGGVILQWGVLTDIPQATTAPGAVGPVRDVSFPVAFPNEAIRAVACMDFATMTTINAFTPGASIISNSVLRLQNNYTASPGRISWWALGY